MKDIVERIDSFIFEKEELDEGALGKILGTIRMELGKKFFSAATMGAIKSRIRNIEDPRERHEAEAKFEELEKHIEEVNKILDQFFIYLEN